MLDFTPFRTGEKTLSQIADPLTKTDLRNLINEMIDLQLAAVADATDADMNFVAHVENKCKGR